LPFEINTSKSNLYKLFEMKNGLIIIALIAFNISLSVARNWDQAQWIWQNQDGPANTWMSFRKTVQIDVIPENVIANIAVDSKFWLWINGELVVFEGGISRGPARAGAWDRENNLFPTNSWYDEVDITPYLQQGENTFALLVWYWGRQTHKGTHVDSKKGGLLFHCALGEDKNIVSDGSWKMKQHPAYDENSGDNGTSIVQYRVKYDARNSLGDWSPSAWNTPGYDDSSWPSAVEKGLAGSAPWYDLEINYVPRLVNHGLEDYENNAALNFPFVSNGNPIVCQLPFNKQITPYFEIETEAGESNRGNH
jgi:alpha-L-rhamnosidase